jgi:hypothetical protein
MVMIIVLFSESPRVSAETTNEDVSKMSASFKSKLQRAIDQWHSHDNASQEKAYESIVLEYINTHTTIPDAVKILRDAGFDVAVWGDGFYEAYPISGSPSRGTEVTAILYYKGSFLSGNSLGIHMFLYPGDYTGIKNVKIGVGTVAP